MSVAELALQQEVHALYSNDHGWLCGCWLRKKMGATYGAADLAHDAFPGLRSSKEAVAIQKPRLVLTAVTQRLNHWHREQIKRVNLEDRKARRGFGVRAGRSCGGIGSGSAAQPRRFDPARAHFSVSSVKSRESDEA